MTPARRRSLVRRLHRGLGWASALLVVTVAATGILLHHPDRLGPAPERVRAVAADPADPDRLLRGVRWGVEVSGDGGATWREAPMLAPPEEVTSIRFAPGPDGTGRVVALGRRTAVESLDGGRIWRALPLPDAVRDGLADLADLAPTADGGLVLATSVGIFRREAAGAWRRVGPAPAAGANRWRVVHDLHTGQVGGAVGRRVVEFGAWGLILLTATGVVLGLRRTGKRS